MSNRVAVQVKRQFSFRVGAEEERLDGIECENGKAIHLSNNARKLLARTKVNDEALDNDSIPYSYLNAIPVVGYWITKRSMFRPSDASLICHMILKFEISSSILTRAQSSPVTRLWIKVTPIASVSLVVSQNGCEWREIWNLPCSNIRRNVLYVSERAVYWAYQCKWSLNGVIMTGQTYTSQWQR